MDWKNFLKSAQTIGIKVLDVYLSDRFTSGVSIHDTAKLGVHTTLAVWNRHKVDVCLRDNDFSAAADYMVKAVEHTVKANEQASSFVKGASQTGMNINNISMNDVSDVYEKLHEINYKSKSENQIAKAKEQHSIKRDGLSEVSERVYKNIEASKEAREHSNFNTGTLDYNEHQFSSKNFDRLLKQRGLSDSEIDNVKKSFNRFSNSRRPNSSIETVVKHTRPEGEEKFVYSSNGDASGVYTTSDIYVDNKTGIDKLATPQNNDFLRADTVRVYGDQIIGTVAPQPVFQLEASIEGRDHIQRIGGGRQSVTNGGYKTGAVQKTGEYRYLTDTAQRRPLLGPAQETEVNVSANKSVLQNSKDTKEIRLQAKYPNRQTNNLQSNTHHKSTNTLQSRRRNSVARTKANRQRQRAGYRYHNDTTQKRSLLGSAQETDLNILANKSILQNRRDIKETRSKANRQRQQAKNRRSNASRKSNLQNRRRNTGARSKANRQRQQAKNRRSNTARKSNLQNRRRNTGARSKANRQRQQAKNRRSNTARKSNLQNRRRNTGARSKANRQRQQAKNRRSNTSRNSNLQNRRHNATQKRSQNNCSRPQAQKGRAQKNVGARKGGSKLQGRRNSAQKRSQSNRSISQAQKGRAQKNVGARKGGSKLQGRRNSAQKRSQSNRSRPQAQKGRAQKNAGARKGGSKLQGRRNAANSRGNNIGNKGSARSNSPARTSGRSSGMKSSGGRSAGGRGGGGRGGGRK